MRLLSGMNTPRTPDLRRDSSAGLQVHELLDLLGPIENLPTDVRVYVEEAVDLGDWRDLFYICVELGVRFSRCGGHHAV